MDFLNKINVNYNIKLIEDLLINKKFDSAINKITNLQKKNKDIFFEIISNLDSKFMDLSHKELFKKKFIWLISFDEKDTNYINKFIEHYCIKTSFSDSLFSEYSKLVSEVVESLKIDSVPKEIDFNYTVHNSSVLQNLILFSNHNSYFFLRACGAFFEFLEKNKYLIYPNSTLCYFYVVRNPKEIFCHLKKNHQSAEASLYELFNFGDALYINEHNKKNDYKYYQNKQSWNTNVISWVDENVLSSYKGNIINYDELRKNTEETLTNIIFHLKQSGLIIDVNYEIISSYVKENPFLEEEFDQVSNNDKKKLSSNLDQSLIEKFNFTI